MLTFGFFASSLFAQSPELTSYDEALISEAFHLQEQLGQLVWNNWEPQEVPFLYKKGAFEYLLFHPNPPEGFQLHSKKSSLTDVYWNTRIDTLDFAATFSVNNLPTVVMTSPENDESITTWILNSAHEMFHVFQFDQLLSEELTKNISVDLENQIYSSEDDILSMFNDPEIRALLRLEADRIYNGITPDSLSQSEQKLLKNRLSDIYSLQPDIFQDTLLSKYKLRMEWTEGVARYVEHQLAFYASNESLYQPSLEFKTLFPEASYKEKADRYSIRRSINPIRFVGAGVRGRIMFYYMGMGKAYLLDRINPDWKSSYFSYTLDQLLAEE